MRRQADSGFTLVELLVSMALLSLLTLTLATGLRSGVRAWQTSSRIAAESNGLRSAEGDIRFALERAYPELVSVDATRVRANFSGSADRMEFLSPMQDGASHRITLSVIGARGDKSLDREDAAELASAGTKPRHTTMLAHVADVAFSYEAAEPENPKSEGPGWSAHWGDSTRLPRAVRIRVTSRGEDEPVDIIAVPRVAAGMDCVFDPFTHFCVGR